MRLGRIRIDRLSGISEPFEILEIPAGAVLIVGPNGIGKTSLCRAMRATLWPRGEPLPGAEVHSWWHSADGPRYALLLAGETIWQQDGAPGESPSLPAAHLRSYYTLGLAALFDTSDETITHEIRRQMSGGFDVASVRESLFPARAQRGRSEARKLEQARRQRSSIETELRRLADEEKRLPGTRHELETAKRARASVEPLHLALELARKRDDLRRLEAELAQFPANMERLRGDELERLADLQREVAELEAEIEIFEARQAEATETIARADLPDGPVAESSVLGTDKRVRQLELVQSTLVAARQRAAVARHKVAQCEDALAGAAVALRRWVAIVACTALLAGAALSWWVDRLWVALVAAAAVLLWATLFDLWGARRWRANAWDRLREARGELADALAGIEDGERNAAQLLAQIQRDLRVHGLEQIEDAAAASEQISQLRKRSAALTQSQKDLARAQKDLRRARDQLEKKRANLEQLFVNGGLESADTLALERRVRLQPEWEELDRERRDLEREIAGLEARLDEYPDYRSLERSQAEARLEDARRTAERTETLVVEITAIETRLREAAKSSDLEQALEMEDAARQALASCREDALRAEAGNLLLDAVIEEHERDTAPAVLRRAMEMFAHFTRGCYELRFDAKRDALFAFDNETETGKALTELSDGTRAQLLLAARLAFACHVEKDERLPLVLDEALATSDPERFEAIADSLLLMARQQGRQLFYLGARGDELARWRAASRRHGHPEPFVIDLAEIRGRGRAVTEPSELMAEPQRLPAPGNRSAEQYGLALSVPRPDPSAPSGAVHLFHALRHDLGLLYRLIDELRVDSLGGWRGLARHGLVGSRLASDEIEQIQAWDDVIRAFLDAYRIGRGRPLDREALAQSGAVSARFIDGLTALADDLGADARQLVRALEEREDARTKKFREDKLEKLVDFFEQRGYLDRREILDEAELLARVLVSVKGHLAAGRLTHGAVADRVACLWRLVGRDGCEPRG
ncbi:MAG: hypothetical protein JSV80_08970 [Acidobacteriota bacterium]|nr:MAG: hypothetical protein JSV80_08970 [Acidobacteriota bacterium]